MVRFEASSPPDSLHTDGMTDVSILTPGRSAVDPIDFPAIEDLEASPIDETHDRCGVHGPCDRRDVVSWTPELWWLLNWWTWLFPPSDESNASNGPASVVIYAMPEIQIVPDSNEGQNQLPALNETSRTEDGASGPPDVGETILRTVNMGNGLIDLFA